MPWPWAKPRLILPRIIGISETGWLALAHGENASQQVYIQLRNLNCEDAPCVSDTPESEDDLCYCPVPGDKNLLDSFAVKGCEFERGTFPAEIAGVRYRVSVEQNSAPGLVLGSRTVVSEVWLYNDGVGRKRLGTIHDHLTSFVNLICVAGWIRNPQKAGKQVGVFVGYAVAEQGDAPDVVRFTLFPANLEHGFEANR